MFMCICLYMHKSAASQNPYYQRLFFILSKYVVHMCICICDSICVHNGRREIILELCLKTADNNCIF